MVEYAVLVAHNATAVIGSFTNSATLWLSRLNWEVIGYAAMVLAGAWFVTWAVKPR
jgi:hypothetical protein